MAKLRHSQGPAWFSTVWWTLASAVRDASNRTSPASAPMCGHSLLIRTGHFHLSWVSENTETSVEESRWWCVPVRMHLSPVLLSGPEPWNSWTLCLWPRSCLWFHWRTDIHWEHHDGVKSYCDKGLQRPLWWYCRCFHWHSSSLSWARIAPIAWCHRRWRSVHGGFAAVSTHLDAETSAPWRRWSRRVLQSRTLTSLVGYLSSHGRSGEEERIARD